MIRLYGPVFPSKFSYLSLMLMRPTGKQRNTWTIIDIDWTIVGQIRMPKDHISSTSHKFLASSLKVITEAIAEGRAKKIPLLSKNYHPLARDFVESSDGLHGNYRAKIWKPLLSVPHHTNRSSPQSKRGPATSTVGVNVSRFRHLPRFLWFRPTNDGGTTTCNKGTAT